jgi:anti-repressor protein
MNTNEIKIFTNAEFNAEIRTVLKNEEIWFVGKDVADALGYSNTRDAISKHVDKEDKNNVVIRDGKGNPNQTVINESGLYSLILSSQLENAKQFKRWVTSEILPSLHKTGIYMTGQSEMNDEEFLANAVLRASAVIEKKNACIQQLENNVKQLENVLEEQEPLVILAQKLEENPDVWHSFKDAASLLNNGYGQNQLFALARKNHDLINGGKQHNHPYQLAVNKGYYKLKINGGHYNYNNEYVPSYKCLVSNKGLAHLIRLIRREQQAN